MIELLVLKRHLHLGVNLVIRIILCRVNYQGCLIIMRLRLSLRRILRYKLRDRVGGGGWQSWLLCLLVDCHYLMWLARLRNVYYLKEV